MFRVLNHVLLLSPLSGAGHFVLASQTLRNSTDPNTSAIVSSQLPNKKSQAPPSTNTSDHQSVNFANVPTPLPYPLNKDNPWELQNWQDLNSGNCTVQDSFCSYEGFNKSIGNASISAFANQCLLWDASCAGNKTLAMDEFFNGTQSDLYNNQCFNLIDQGVASPQSLIAENNGTMGNLSQYGLCETYNPPERILAWKKIKSWMRTPECAAAKQAWAKQEKIPNDYWSDPNYANAASPCCRSCAVWANNVDLYYWPEPDINTSCLSIIGNSVHPYDFGATTAGYSTYWACAAKTTVTSTSTWTGNSLVDAYTTTTTISLITTAAIQFMANIPVKMPLINPWASSPCTEVDTTPRGPNSSNNSVENHGQQAIQARGHTLIIPSPITSAKNLTVSTLVVGNFTFTSPSVYANFESIIASDMCGINVISSTMLSFAPGELSTIGGRPNVVDPPVQSTKRFDFRDLPCPPQSIMEANWYKPQAGEPYRPLIAMPSQLKREIPWFSSCQNVFTAYDPPHALPTVTAFGPGPIPGRHAGAQLPTPAPSATFDPGARKTTPGAVPVLPITDDPAMRRPKATIGQVPLPKLGGPNSEPSDPNKESDGKQAGDLKHGSDSKHASETSGDPNQGDKTEEGSGPRNGSGNSDDPSQDNNSPSGNDPQQDSGDSGVSSQGDSTTVISDPKNDGGTGRSPSEGNDAQQSRGTDVNPGREVDSNLPSLPFRPTVAVNGDQDTSPLAGSIIPDEPNHIDNSNADSGEPERNSFGSSANDASNNLVPHGSQSLVLGTPIDSSTSPIFEPIVTTIAGQAITAAPTAIKIPGTMIKQGDSGVTLRGTPVAPNPAGQLVVDSKIIQNSPGANSKPLTTTVGGRIIAATSGGIAIAGTTLVPGDAGVSLDGTLPPLDTAGHFVVGSKTQTFESESVSLDAVTGGTIGPGGQSTPLVATPLGNVANETARRNSTVNGVQPFEGKADHFFYGLRTSKGVVVVVAVVFAIFV